MYPGGQFFTLPQPPCMAHTPGKEPSLACLMLLISLFCVTRYTTKADGQYCDGNVKKKYYTRLMSSTHLLGNKLVSSEKPGWVAAAAKGGGVLRQYLQAEALALPLQLPGREGGNCVLSLDLEAAGCQLPTPTRYVYTT